MRIVVVGGGKVGYYLVKTLAHEGHDVSVIETDERLCSTLAAEFGALVIRGDGTSLQALEDAGIGDADAIAAVTGQDETNLVICQLAKRVFHVRRTIARCNNPKNQAVFRRLGVDRAVSSTGIIADYMEREVALDAVKTLLTFEHGDMALLEADLGPQSPATEKAVKDLPLPQDCVLVAVVRGQHVIFPRGDTRLEAGDAVLAMTTESRKAELTKALTGRNGR
ncbi:MAG: potassium channel family protein [Symbiobacteriia bacterium]